MRNKWNYIHSFPHPRNIFKFLLLPKMPGKLDFKGMNGWMNEINVREWKSLKE